MKIRLGAMAIGVALLLAACGDDDGADAPDPTTTEGSADVSGDEAGGGSDNSGSGDSGSDDADAESGDSDPDDNDSDTNEIDNNASGDDDDFGDIIGDDDFDADELDDDTADMVDEIDDLVSVGDCVAETIGIGAVAPEGWFCTVLETPLPGLDGFTLRSSDSNLEITIGSPIPFGPCDFEGFCDNVEPVAIEGFGDAFQFAQAGVAGGVTGTHDELEVALTVSKIGGVLEPDEVTFIQDYVATLVVL